MSTSSVTLRTAKKVHQGARSVSIYINTWNEIVNEHLALEQKLASQEKLLHEMNAQLEDKNWPEVKLNLKIQALEQKLKVAVEALTNSRMQFADRIADAQAPDSWMIQELDVALALINPDPMVKAAKDTIQMIREMYNPDAQKGKAP